MSSWSICEGVSGVFLIVLWVTDLMSVVLDVCSVAARVSKGLHVDREYPSCVYFSLRGFSSSSQPNKEVAGHLLSIPS